MNEFFPPSLATILNVILPIWLIIQLFQIKQPHPLKVIPILLNLNKWYHHWPFFFVQKCTKYQMVCHPCEEKYETSLFKWWFQQRQKCEQNFSFGLNVGVFLKTTKGTFLIIKEKKIHRKKKTFLLFLLLSSYRFLVRFQKTLPFPLKLSFPLIFFRINAAKFWKCYRFQCFGFFKLFLCHRGKRKWQWKKNEK